MSQPGIPPSPDDPEADAVDALVAEALAGDSIAFDRLTRTFHPRVYRWAVAFTADADEAEDVAQEAFVTVLRQLRHYRGDGGFPAWLHQITRRTAGQLRRTRQRRTRLAASPKAAPQRLLYETDPGARIDRERMSALVRRYWEELPERQRTVLDLVDVQGYSPALAASMLALNPVTLRANLFKARQSLRRRLLLQFGDTQHLMRGERDDVR